MGHGRPPLNNTTTTTYTFTPNSGECATTQTLTIVVNQSITPTFDPVPAICEGDIISPLPTTSTNNVSGTWSPALDNMATTTYTFTPAAGECPIPATLTIVVYPKPSVELDDIYAICTNTNGTEIFQSSIIDTGLSGNNYSFEWTNATGVIVGTNSSFEPLVGGNYSVLVTNLTTGCQNEDSAMVVESSPPILELNSTSGAFASEGMIEVSATGTGVYQFSLDNGAWQDSPYFSNVTAGDHVVLARDKNGCGFASIEVCLIGYSKFFTPNGDNINETWNIKGVSCIENAEIYIYDRYGKLLKQINSNGGGWNGTYNSELLPTSDYWFVVRYLEFGSTNVREYTGHFTLKR